jgi:predicted exporter/lauroyl/myristoyl acyltransferase
MKPRWFRWWWGLLLIPIAAGFARLHFEADVLNLLPGGIPEVQGLKLYQQHFGNSSQLIITVQAKDAVTAKSTAQAIAENMRRSSNLIADVTWEPPWLDHPEQMAELIGYLWLNQPPQVFNELADRLAETNLPNVLAATRDRLATSLSPTDLGELSYDPFGLTQLPEGVTSAAPSFGQGDNLFASADGAFRIIFVKSAQDIGGYREASDWLTTVKTIVGQAVPSSSHVAINYTGRPAFVAEISASMKHDIVLSVGGTAVIIAILFWLAHRRVKPMLWLLTLLALILISTLGLGSLLLGPINVVSMGFAAILLGLAVDYAVVHYQEALAYPTLSVPEIRRAIAPSIFWAATTTICAFLSLNFGGLPGLAQLGSLVGIGVGLSAFVMIMCFLPPLFPDRMVPRSEPSPAPKYDDAAEPLNPLRAKFAFLASGAVMAFCAAVLWFGLPKMDTSTHALEPRNSPAYATIDAITKNLGQNQQPLWVVITGANEQEVSQRLASLKPAFDRAVTNGLLAGYTLPDVLWPNPAFQSANRAQALHLAGEESAMKQALLTNGFTADALGLNKKIFDTWRAAAASGVFWPTNSASRWIFEKIAAHDPSGPFAAAFLYPGTKPVTAQALALPKDGVWLSSWSLLGTAILEVVKHNLWKLLVPMIGLVLLSLWLAFHRFTEICLSLGVLVLSGFCLLTAMKLAGWSWNILNLMALPLILGTGVDYSLFMQLALRRHGGSLNAAWHSVGRALLLCGGTAIAGFGSLGFSSNAGMSSLGQVCAAGLAGNMLISIFLLPVWWKMAVRRKSSASELASPSPLYHSAVWKFGLAIGRILPASLGRAFARMGAAIYWRLAPHRREIVTNNLRPVLKDEAAATRAARELFTEFALKVVDLWGYEAGLDLGNWTVHWKGWEIYVAAQARGRGVLLVTPHLGNWEIGGAHVPQKGFSLLVLTQPEPDPRLTELRQASRAFRGVETLVVGSDAFAFIDIIKRLQQGATVALLMDRPATPSAVTVNLFGRPFSASIAAAELARASGCAILPGCIVRSGDGVYEGELKPEIHYDRAAIGNRAGRIQLTQEIMRVFEPEIQQHITQWFHFVPIWPNGG